MTPDNPRAHLLAAGHDEPCQCRLCWLSGKYGDIPADWPTAANPAKVPAPAGEPEPPPPRSLFDEVPT